MADGVTPVEEIVRGLDDLARAGKIHYAGLSDFPAWRASRAATIAELRGWIPIAGLQLEYSLVERTPDRELLPMAEGLGMGAALWSPLGGGFLTGKYRRGEEGRLQRLGALVHGDTTPQKTQILDTVLAVAANFCAEPARAAIAWLRHHAATVLDRADPDPRRQQSGAAREQSRGLAGRRCRTSRRSAWIG